MLIRRETPQDVDATGAVTTAAFRPRPDAPEPAETALVSSLRQEDGWLPALSLVAVADDAVIGHVVCSRGFVDDTPALGLGPISVLPDRQGGGVGHALMHSVLGAADATDEPLVALLGDPAFYRRFGFVAASELGIVAPDPAWGRHFQARALSSCPPGLTGIFRYASSFAGL
jgi:putative acetyltransferase